MVSFSIWLQPARSSPEFRRLSGLIQQLASAHGAQPFEPHVTLFSSIPADSTGAIPKEADRQLSRLAASLAPFEVRLLDGGLATCTSWHQNVLLFAEETEELRRANAAAIAAFRGPDAPAPAFAPPTARPHLSLMYGDHAPADREAAAAEVRSTAPWAAGGLCFQAEALQVWDTSGGLAGVPRWRLAASYRLVGEQAIPPAVPVKLGHVGITVVFQAKDAASARTLAELGRAHFDRQLSNEARALRATILTSSEHPTKVAFVEEWSDQAAYDEHKETSHLKHFQALMPGLLAGSPAETVSLEHFSAVQHFEKPSYALGAAGILVTFTAKDEEAASRLAEVGWAHFARQLAAEPGATRASVLAGSASAPRRVVFLEQWREALDYKEDFPRGHQNSPHLKLFLESAGPLLDGGVDVEFWDRMEHFAKSRVP